MPYGVVSACWLTSRASVGREVAWPRRAVLSRLGLLLHSILLREVLPRGRHPSRQTKKGREDEPPGPCGHAAILVELVCHDSERGETVGIGDPRALGTTTAARVLKHHGSGYARRSLLCHTQIVSAKKIVSHGMFSLYGRHGEIQRDPARSWFDSCSTRCRGVASARASVGIDAEQGRRASRAFDPSSDCSSARRTCPR